MLFQIIVWINMFIMFVILISLIILMFRTLYGIVKDETYFENYKRKFDKK